MLVSDEFRFAHIRTRILTRKCRRMQDELADTAQKHIISSFCAHRKPQFPRIIRTKTDSPDCIASARLVEFMGRGLCRIRWYVVISNIASRTQRWKEDDRSRIGISPTRISFEGIQRGKLLLLCGPSIVSVRTDYHDWLDFSFEIS